MIRALASRISSGKLFEIQKNQYSDVLVLEDTVLAQSSKIGRVAVSNLGHFLNKFITGSFDTLYSVNDNAQPVVAHTIDNGVCFLRGQLFDQAGNRRLFSDFIPLDLWLTPGRRKSNTAENVQSACAGTWNPTPQPAKADGTYPLFYPVEFEYLFGANSEIQLEVKNDSNVSLSYSIAFHGIRIISNTARS